jgi:pre-mRNA-processing factor SLU7
MRSNPRPQEIAEDSTYGGDNFIRHTGDVSELANTQLFAWEAYNKGEDAAHLQANPTQVELARKQFHERKEKILEAKKKKRLEEYGGQEHMKQLKHAERFGEESRYVEYDSNGNVVKGFEVAAPRSKYIEDQHPHGHTSTWGSYFDKGKCAKCTQVC